MQQTTNSEMVVLARISGWKCLVGGIAMLALGIAPNLPGFGQGLSYSAFLYTTDLGVTVRLAACGFLIILGVFLSYGAVLAAVGSPRGVWLVGDEVRWGRIGTKRVALSALASAVFDPKRRGILLERRDGEKPMLISTMGLRSQDAPEPLASKLRDLTAAT